MRNLFTLFATVFLVSSAQASQDCEFLNADDLSPEDISIMFSVRPAQATPTSTRLTQEAHTPGLSKEKDQRICYLLIFSPQSGSEPVMKPVNCEAITTGKASDPAKAG